MDDATRPEIVVNDREVTVIENLTAGKALGFAIETEQIGQEMYQKLAGQRD